MKSLKECLLESQVNEAKASLDVMISTIIDQNENNGKKFLNTIIKKSIPEIVKLTGCSKSDVEEVLEYIVEHVTISIEDWEDDIRDNGTNDETSMKMFISSFTEGWYDNTVDDDPDREDDLEGIRDESDAIADIVVKHLINVYKL